MRAARWRWYRSRAGVDALLEAEQHPTCIALPTGPETARAISGTEYIWLPREHVWSMSDDHSLSSLLTLKVKVNVRLETSCFALSSSSPLPSPPHPNPRRLPSMTDASCNTTEPYTCTTTPCVLIRTPRVQTAIEHMIRNSDTASVASFVFRYNISSVIEWGHNRDSGDGTRRTTTESVTALARASKTKRRGRTHVESARIRPIER